MSIPCDKIFQLVPSSRSSVKVKVEYLGHNFQKMAIAGALVFHKHILFCLSLVFVNLNGTQLLIGQNGMAKSIRSCVTFKCF